MRSDDLPAIRAGFLSEDPDSIREVASWIRLVLDAGWALVDAEALRQDILTELVTMGRAGRIRADRDFRAFVRHVARVRAIDAYRAQRLRRHAPLDAADNRHDVSIESSISVLQRREREQLAQFIFQTLTPACRQLLRWVLGEDRSHEWIATRLEINEGASRARAHRCMERARQISKRFAPDLGEVST